MNNLCLILLISCMSVASLCFSQQQEDTMTNKAQEKNPIVLMKTSLGEVKIELYSEKAPISVKNFLQYVNEGHFSNTIFHRIIPNFMVQGGGFTKDMDQKPTHAKIQNEAENGLKNERGTLAMARTGEVNSATSQFFINLVNNDFLDFKDKSPRGYGYCVFGKVTEGMDIVDKMAKVKTTTKEGHADVPVEPIEILSMTIVK